MTEPKRDQYGRYLIPVNGGDPTAHTRCTTVADTLDDRTLLEKYHQRNVAKGIALRDDLYALAQATPLSEKSTLNRLCKEAMAAAAAGARANKGTALHTVTEQLDRGQVGKVPAMFDEDVRAYRECLTANGIEINPEWIEVIGVCDALPEPVAGTIDRIVRWDNRWVVGDLKSGDELKWAWRKIVQQLAIYSRSRYLYDPATDELVEMPDVDQEQAIVFHLPAGKGVCKAYTVDLIAGWQAAQAACWVRGWRKREDLATPLAEAA